MNIKQLARSNETVIIDVRTPWEYSMGHIPGSMNITLAEIPSNVENLRVFKGPLILVCASGNRSGQATNYLRKQGFDNVFNGGAWEEAAANLEKRA